MDTGRLAKLGLALAAVATLGAAVLAFFLPDMLQRSLTGAVAVLAFVVAIVIVRLDATLEGRTQQIARSLADAEYARTDERERADQVRALRPAVDDVLDRQASVGDALASEETALNDTHSANTEAMRNILATGTSLGSLSKSVDDSSAAIEEMVSSIRLVSDNIGGIADTVNSVSSAIGELAVSISQVAGNAQEANTLSLQADTKARDGGKAVERLVESTREIAVDISTVVKKMEELGDASARIGNIVEVIDNIADQTNLLALNAAIEAARAGEHGRGFAVVADEVRKLAENSATSTKQISSLIKDIQTKTAEVVRSTTASGTKAESGLQMADLAGRAISDILGAVAEASRLIEQISTAAKEQALGSSAIVNSVEQMNALMREAARSLDEQNTSNQQMISTITAMQTLTDGVHAAVAAQRDATERIDAAARRLADANGASRRANAGSDDAAQALRAQLAEIASSLTAPKLPELEHAVNGRARLTSGR